MTELSVYDIEDRLLTSLRARQGSATASDVAADTGLPLGDVESALRRMLSTYKSHLDVDEDGRLRYRFDPGFVRRGEEPGRFWYDLRQRAWEVFKVAFKVGIMVTLVGYTVAFVLLLLALAVAGIAAATASDSDGDGLGELLFLPLRLILEVLEFMFWFDLAGGNSSALFRRRIKRKRERPEKPLYQRIFDFVFGPEVERDPLAMHRAFAQFVRERKGRVTAAEWASRTGQSLEDAEHALTASLLRFHGDLDVAGDGTLIYRFDSLRQTVAEDDDRFYSLPPIWGQRAKARSLTGNASSTNTWIGVFNAFNLMMATGVTFFALDAGALGGLGVALGVIPLVFSLLFFAIPTVRAIQHSGEVRAAELSNQRRAALQEVYRSVHSGRAQPIPTERLGQSVANEVILDFDGEVEVTDDGRTVVLFPKLADSKVAVERARERADEEVVFGRSIFSSDDDEVSLAQAELEDFDARLARELGEQEVAFTFEVPVPAPASSS
ncbi:MAG: hypothetical protein AAGI01_04820 [Myxococcota bacterium]